MKNFCNYFFKVKYIFGFFHYFVPKTKIKVAFARDNIENRIKLKRFARVKTLKKIDKIEKK